MISVDAVRRGDSSRLITHVPEEGGFIDSSAGGKRSGISKDYAASVVQFIRT